MIVNLENLQTVQQTTYMCICVQQTKTAGALLPDSD